MTIDGKIEGYIEHKLFAASLNLTFIVLGSNWEDPSKLPAVRQTSQRVTRDGTATISSDLVDNIYANMISAYQRLQANAQLRTSLGVTEARLKFFKDVMSDVELASANQNGLNVSKNRKFPKADFSASPRFASLLERFKLRKQREKPTDLIKGQIPFLKDNGKRYLVIVHFDRHDDPEVQKQIRENVLRLHKAGLKGQVQEGITGERSYIKDYTHDLNKRYNIHPGRRDVSITFRASGCIKGAEAYLATFEGQALPAVYYVECLLGDAIDTFGAEDPGLMRQAKYLVSRSSDVLGPYGKPQAEAETGTKRGTKLVENELARMDEKGFTVANFTVGSEHIEEVFATLDEADVNYVGVGVPRLVELLPKE